MVLDEITSPEGLEVILTFRVKAWLQFTVTAGACVLFLLPIRLTVVMKMTLLMASIQPITMVYFRHKILLRERI